MMNNEPIKDLEPRPAQDDADRSGHSDQKENAPLEFQTASFEPLDDSRRKMEPQASGKSDAVQTLNDVNLQTILDLCQQSQVQLHGTEKTAIELKRGQELLAAKLREVSDKIDDVTTSLSEPRIRELLTSLLLLHDLVDQMASTATDKNTTVEHERNYGVLLSQIRQILELHGIEVISTDVIFNENLHRAIRTIATDDPSKDGRITQVFQKGFRTQRRILRYANVEVITLAADTKEGDIAQGGSEEIPSSQQTLSETIPENEKTSKEGKR